MITGHHFFDMAQHKIHDTAFNRAEHVAHFGNNDIFHLCARQYQFQRIGKIFQYDDGASPTVVQLVLQFARRVQRIGIHHHQARFQNAEHGNRILQDIRHHDGHTFAARELQHVLQIRCNLVG